MKVALTIAGSDSGGGAGLQADLKTFVDHGVWGASVVTALTAQNTIGVLGVSAVAPEFVKAQLDAVLGDLRVDVVKIGMLATATIAEVVAIALDARPDLAVVLDPVCVSTSGHRLLDDDAIGVLLGRLVPRATVVTPNTQEWTLLGGADAFGTATVLLKGGDAEGDVVVDVLMAAGTERLRLSAPRLPGGPFHGTGCTLSSAIAARLARGETLEAAVRGATGYVRSLLANGAGWSPGRGLGGLPHGSGLRALNGAPTLTGPSPRR